MENIHVKTQIEKGKERKTIDCKKHEESPDHVIGEPEGRK